MAQNSLTPGADTNGSPETNLIDFWKIAHVLQRWWWLICLVIIFITTIAAILVLRMTPIYMSSSLLEVKQEERNIIDVSEVERVVVDKEFLSTQIELLQSKALIEDTIETLDLLRDPFLAPLDNPEWTNKPRQTRLSGLISVFDSNLSVAAVNKTRLINVRFEHSDPQKAALITNTLVENYIANGLSRKYNTTAFARKFLEDRLKTVRASLEVAERDLVAYATKNSIIIADNEGSQQAASSLDIAALKVMKEELTNASLARVEAEIAYNQSRSSGISAEMLENNALSKLKEERLKLNSEYLEKRARFKPAFPEMVELRARIDLFDQEIAAQESAITSTSDQSVKNIYDLALAKEQDLKSRVYALEGNVVNVREKSVDYNILKRQVETERTQYEALLQRLKEVSVADDLGSNLVEVVDLASPPLTPFKPNRLRTIILALLLSSILGFGIAYAIELIDDRVKTPEDVKNKLKQIIMGVIPVSKTPDDFSNVLMDPQSSVSEAYSSLRTNLQFSGADGGPRVIQITSTRSGEGKSVSSLGVALRFVGIGHNVLLIDADMRRPTFHLKENQKSIGLSGILTQKADFESNVDSTSHEGLDLIHSGVSVPNPSELLANNRFDELLAWAKEKYDYVIVDSPPVLGLADAPIIGAKVSATVLVVDAGILRTPNVRGSIERLQGSGTKILGVVLTKYKAQAKGYMNYYQYTYGAKASQYDDNTEKKSKTAKSKRKLKL